MVRKLDVQRMMGVLVIVVVAVEKDVCFPGEVAEDRADRDIGAIGDVAERGRFIALREEESTSVLDDPLARLLFLAFAKTGRRRHSTSSVPGPQMAPLRRFHPPEPSR